MIDLLKEWKSRQQEKLAKFKIEQTEDQYVLTQSKMNDEINSKVHTDYLNHQMKAVKKRHPELEHLTPHKLRHTFATIAKQGGANMAMISEALTHSDLTTTLIYVNSIPVVDSQTHDAFEKELGLNRVSKSKKETLSAVTESVQSVEI